MTLHSQKLRDSARGKECKLRFSCCTFNPEQTVLAHVPCGMRGTSMKGPDVIACFGCSRCHAVLDTRPWEVDSADVLRAVAETQMIWIREGLLKVEGVRA